MPGATSPATSQLHGQRPPTFKHLGRQLTIEYRPIAALVPYANNPRTHSDRQIAKIAASIRTFGFTKPILTDGSDGVIAGRGRIQAAQLLGMETVPTIRLEHLSEAQRRAHVIADYRRRSLSAIAQAILDGQQPVTLTVTGLKRLPALPLRWDEQPETLGFPRKA